MTRLTFIDIGRYFESCLRVKWLGAGNYRGGCWGEGCRALRWGVGEKRGKKVGAEMFGYSIHFVQMGYKGYLDAGLFGGMYKFKGRIWKKAFVYVGDDGICQRCPVFFETTRKNEHPKKAPPSFYQVTNNSKERPDVWVDSPEKSIILSITSDIRTISSEVFAAPYSLRFPRIDRVRYDKPWHECLDVQSFVELVHSSNGTTQRGADYGVTDVSHVKGETLIFSNMMFYFVNLPPGHSLDSLHKMVVENGGTFSMNLNNSVSHCVTAESKGIKFEAAKCRGDIIHYSWLFDCCSQKKLLPLQPKYFVFLSDSSKKKLQEEIDEFSDSYYCDLDTTDIKQLLSSIRRIEDSKTIDYYKQKFCPKDKWSHFYGCCIYFHLSKPSCSEWKVLLELELTRMKLEISMGGGKVSDNLSRATHLLVMSFPGFDVDFDAISNSFSAAEKHLLLSRRLHIVRSQWLEDSLEKGQKLLEETYSLKPSGLGDSIGECKRDLDLGDNSSFADVEKQIMSTARGNLGKRKAILDKPRIINSPMTDGRRIRGRPPSSKNEDTHWNQLAILYENESDTNACSDENAVKESEMGGRNHESHGMAGKPCPGILEDEMVEDSDISQRGRHVGQEIADDIKRGECFDEVHRIGSGDGNIAQCSEKLGKLEMMVDPVHAVY
ncbi:unnamed protein product [Ilex paraguariensis]|uniref:BRCT domain-containing protein n=1 Tax=Ilex paraguariensis TaxID=185542 RepID=A0ABC8UB54_9AQUA